MRNIVSPLSGFLSPFGQRSVGSLFAYAAAGITPPFVADFSTETYATDTTETTFSDLLTHSRTSNATMIDADGLLKWAPHNLVTYSEQFDNAAWSKLNGSLTLANAVVAPDGTMTADEFTSSAAFGTLQQTLTLANVKHKFSVWIKAGTSTSDWSLYDASSGVTIATISPTSDWQLLTGEWTPSTATSICRITDRDNSNTGSIYAWGAHLYRSDLGGMVNNPDRTDTYVPTVASPVYLPRRNAYAYIDGVLTKAGLQFESAAATNLVTYSEDFSNAAWAKSNTTVTANAAVAPDGTTTADKLLDDTSAGVHAAQQTFAVVGGVSYTLSIYAKASEKTWFTIDPVYPSVANNITYFNLTDGTVGTNDADNTASIESVGDGWYLCRVTHTTNAAQTSMFFEVATANSDGGISYTGDGSSGVFIWGAQGEVGSTPSSYIPTAVATATRAAETLTVPIANMDYSATAMSFQMDGFMTGTSRTFADWTLDASNSILMQSGASDFTFTQEAGGVVDTVTGGSYTSGINVPFSIASRHGSTFINGAVDGTALTADLTPVALPDLSATDLSLAPTFNGYISKFLMWGQDIGDLGIAEASG